MTDDDDDDVSLYEDLCRRIDIDPANGEAVAEALSDSRYGKFRFDQTPPASCSLRGHFEYIYALVDPRDEKVRYVGRTICDLRTRLWAHNNERTQQLHRPKNVWLNELNKLGLRPRIDLLEVCFPKSASEAERKWIHEMLDRGEQLTNKKLPRRR